MIFEEMAGREMESVCSRCLMFAIFRHQPSIVKFTSFLLVDFYVFPQSIKQNNCLSGGVCPWGVARQRLTMIRRIGPMIAKRAKYISQALEHMTIDDVIASFQRILSLSH
jgi:hypothetical protein